MKHSPGKQIVALFSIFMLVFCSVTPALAAVHPLSRLDHNSSTGVSDIDITISLDWDPAKYSTPEVMTKAGMTNAVKSYAASLYAMTSGLHRLRNVYIYKNKKFWTNADIQYVSAKPGRSEANVAAWKVNNEKITMYVYESQGVLDANPGPVMAHESGHYIYGFWDEYREEDGKTIKDLVAAAESWKPSGEDFETHPSIMNQHATYPNWLSTAETYAGSADRLNTAHYRMYGKSIWDTLVSDPRNDPAQMRDYNRIWFEAFRNKQFNKSSDLKIGATVVPKSGAVKGYDDALNIVWADDTPVLNMVVLDTNIPASSWNEALSGAAELPQKLPAGSVLQVLSGSSSTIDSTTITEDNRAALTTNLKKTVQTAQVTVEAALWAAVTRITGYYKTEKPKQVTKLTLIAASNPTVSDELLLALQQSGASVDVFQLKSGTAAAKASARPAPSSVRAAASSSSAGQQIYLSQLAQQTGGSLKAADSEAELQHWIYSAAMENEEMVMAVISDAQATSLAAGQSLTIKVPTGRHDTVPMIMIEVPPSDFSRFSLTVTSPTGAALKPVASPTEGVWSYAVDTDSTGTGSYTATLTANEAVNGDMYMVAYSFNLATEAPLLMQMNVIQRPVSGNMLEVSLNLDRPVLQATVQAIVYDETGNEVLRLTPLDDGKNGDRRADDGIYAASLNQLAPGEYYFRVVAHDNGGKAVASNRGMPFNPYNAAAADEATGTFQRTDEQAFAMTAFTASTGGDSGGCAVGNGSSADLLLALGAIFPLLYLALPRRREDKEQP